jgi:hypothetical protein
MVNSFFDADEKYDTNEARKLFAEEVLEDLSFLYAETNSGVSSANELVYSLLTCPKTFRGLFQSPFILRTFAAHYVAIRGARKIDAFGDMHAPEKRPKGSLALSITGVSAIPRSHCATQLKNNAFHSSSEHSHFGQTDSSLSNALRTADPPAMPLFSKPLSSQRLVKPLHERQGSMSINGEIKQTITLSQLRNFLTRRGTPSSTKLRSSQRPLDAAPARKPQLPSPPRLDPLIVGPCW